MEILTLKNNRQWVNWNYKGTTKIPLSSKNQRTGTNKQYQNTWATFEEVKANTKANGIGLILTNGVCGIDIDKRDLNDSTTQDIFELMDTYTEYSPSGNGFHLLFTVDMDKIPNDIHSKYYQKNPHNKIECYISELTNRYFTFTENVIIDKPINERTEQLLIFLDKYMQRPKTNIENGSDESLENSCQCILDIISKTEQAEKFDKLYFQGDISQYGDDESSADMALCSILAFYCGEDFELIDTLFTQSKLYRQKWDRTDYKYNTIKKAIDLYNGNFYRNGINFRLLEKLKKLTPEKRYTQNDIGMSELFADIYKSKIRYNVTAKQWYYFNGKVWKEDTGSMITLQKMKELSKALIVYGSSITDDSRRGNFVRFVNQLGNYNTREKIVKDSKTKLYIEQAKLDSNINLFNCQNGTLNLKTFEFTPHNSNEFLSKISNVHYNPKAQCPIFDNFINEVMKDNQDKIKFLQTIFGYSLTTDTSQETCFIIYGPSSRNGKSTLMDTILYMLGDYATTTMPETLSTKKMKDSSKASSDIARLDGCRLLNISEPPQEMIIDSALLKTLLGKDKIPARYMYKEFFEFYPIFKVFINTNYLPVIDDNTVFDSGRVNVITFDRHFSPDEQKKSLKQELKSQDEISGIFNWCLNGLKTYTEEGLIIPEEVEQATKVYELSNDKLNHFIMQEMIESDDNVTLADVYYRYCRWCKKNNLPQLSKSEIKRKFKERNLFKEQASVYGKTRQNVIVGYVLRLE